MQYHFDIVSTIFGNFFVLDSRKGLHFIIKKNDQRVKILKSTYNPQKNLYNANIRGNLVDLCMGKKISQKIKIHFLGGTSLQKKAWRQLQKIQMGETISYSNLSSKVSNKNFVRSVASAVGKNPIGVIIPCHRVITKDGSIGGYAWGIKMKARLLDIEFKGTADSIYRGGK